ARWFWAIVTLQVVALVAWAGYYEYLRQQAPGGLLKTRPVEPREWLRGDYMILGYEIADVPLPETDVPKGAVWVVLERREIYHEAVVVAATRPELQPGQIAVRAQRYWGQLRFGIESFYVPEGKGTPEFDKIEVEASVSPAGRLYIKRVLLDGREYP